MTRAFALAALLFATPLFGQTITIPPEIPAQPGQWVVVSPETDCKAVTYVGLDGLSAFPSSELKDPKKLVVNAVIPGRYRFTAVGSLNDVHATASFTIVVAGVVPPTPPTPTPIPPTPTPTPPGPTPGPPIPGPGSHALFVYESGDLAKLPPSQLSVLYSSSVRKYLAEKKVDFRFYDADVLMQGESPTWIEAMKRPRGSLPWCVLSNSVTGVECPLPATIDEMMTMLKKYFP